MARIESDGQIDDPICIRQSEYDELKAEMETLKNDAAAAVSQIHGHRDNIRKLELQINAMRPVFDAALDIGKAAKTGKGAEASLVVLLNKISQYEQRGDTEKRVGSFRPVADNCSCGVSSGQHAEGCPEFPKVVGHRPRDTYR